MSDWATPAEDSLALRVMSAIALIAVGLGAAIAGGPWLAAAAAAAVVAMSFEWARMMSPSDHVRVWMVMALGGFAAVAAASWGAIGWATAVLIATALLATLAHAGKARGRIEAGFGALYVGAPCACFVWLRGLEPGGLALALCLFAVIWSADIAAYFGGRFIGGPRILPALSPRKTWAGVGAGVAAAAAAGAGAAEALDAPIALGLTLGAVFGAVGLSGDLFESLVKRRFGVKDASNLIPGHGGVLDRLDGLMAATLAAAALISLQPGAWAKVAGGGA